MCSPGAQKLQRQLRRFILTLLRTFPAEDAPMQLRRVRLYPWLAACMSIRLSVAANYDFDTAARFHSTVANHQKRRMAPPRAAATAGGSCCVCTPLRFARLPPPLLLLRLRMCDYGFPGHVSLAVSRFSDEPETPEDAAESEKVKEAWKTAMLLHETVDSEARNVADMLNMMQVRGNGAWLPFVKTLSLPPCTPGFVTASILSVSFPIATTWCFPRTSCMGIPHPCPTPAPPLPLSCDGFS
jgi:hypothetical protein